MSTNNCASPATGYPNIIPSQDMILGCYYLTVENLSIYYLLNNIKVFSSFDKVLLDYRKSLLKVHDFIWVSFNGRKDLGVLSINVYNRRIKNLSFIL